MVAVAVVDGFYGCGSGAGWSNRALIEILAEVLPVDVDLVVLPVRVDADSGRWQREWRRAVEEALDRSLRLVEGSQSPISVKAPCAESDLDILVAVQSADDLTPAREVLDGLAEQMDHVPVPLSLGVVHARLLDLPNFYSALSLDPAAPPAMVDRHRP